MTYRETCPHCGHIVTAYRHRLNSVLVSTLKKVVFGYIKHHKRLKLSEYEFTNSEYSNLPKLFHFRAIHKNQNGYVPTQAGYNFIMNGEPLPNIAVTLASEILPSTHEACQDVEFQNAYFRDFKEVYIAPDQVPYYQEQKGFTKPNLFEQ